jgi:hypothetical protein
MSAPSKHSSTFMVGEARAHVQGESLKARAALLTEASQLPDHQGGAREMQFRKFIFGSFLLLVFSAGASAQEVSYACTVDGRLECSPKGCIKKPPHYERWIFTLDVKNKAVTAQVCNPGFCQAVKIFNVAPIPDGGFTAAYIEAFFGTASLAVTTKNQLSTALAGFDGSVSLELGQCAISK